jgi:ERCC4-type nuclease
MNLIVDSRERDIADGLTSKNISFTTKQLDLGDFLFEDDKGNAILVIERKTVSDLKASIIDGRSREQKMRLLNSGIQKTRIMYLIEGNLDKDLEDKLFSMKVGTLLGSLINTMFRDDIKVYKTATKHETVEFLTRLLEKFKKDLDEFFKSDKMTETSSVKHTTRTDVSTEYASTLSRKKKGNMTTNVWFISVLSQIPGISEKIAIVIVEKYSSMAMLYSTYELYPEKERKDMLIDITYPINNDKKRRIGPTLSNRVYEYVYGISQT